MSDFFASCLYLNKMALWESSISFFVHGFVFPMRFDLFSYRCVSFVLKRERERERERERKKSVCVCVLGRAGEVESKRRGTFFPTQLFCLTVFSLNTTHKKSVYSYQTAAH